MKFKNLCNDPAKKAWLLVAGSVLSILGGCAALSSSPAAFTPAPISALIARAGRFAVHYVDVNGTARNVYGHFEWHDDGSIITVKFLNPLGQTRAMIQSSPLGATLELPQRAPYTAQNVEDLMQNTLGFALPIGGLRYWLQSAAAPTSSAHIHNDPHTGRPLHIQQDGWTIDYIDASASSAMQRINLKRAAPPIEVKLVVHPR